MSERAKRCEAVTKRTEWSALFNGFFQQFVLDSAFRQQVFLRCFGMSDASRLSFCGHTLLALYESVEWAGGCLIAFNAESRWARWPCARLAAEWAATSGSKPAKPSILEALSRRNGTIPSSEGALAGLALRSTSSVPPSLGPSQDPLGTVSKPSRNL